MVLLALLALDVLPEQAEAHLLGEHARVDLVVVAGGQQRGEEDALQLGLREVVDGQVAQLLQHGRLVARLHDRLVGWSHEVISLSVACVGTSLIMV